MAIVNCTPNSFSDGGEYFEYASFRERMLALLANPYTKMIDVGAESTAPKNSAISGEEEIQRLERFLLRFLREEKQAERQWPEEIQLSIDTYRPQTLRRLLPQLEELEFLAPVYWNDVSGCLDEACRHLLDDFPRLHYIYCHNLVPRRELTSEHMQFVSSMSGPELCETMISQWRQGLKLLGERSVSLDVNFGFAKNRQQNLFLLDHFFQIIQAFSPDRAWVVGISRKSFLRPEASSGMSQAEGLRVAEEKQRHQISDWSQLPVWPQITMRVHDLSFIP
jgi:dihydropteroate synthase